MNFLQQIRKNFLDMLYPVPKECPLCGQNPRYKDLICKKCASQLARWQQGSVSGQKLSTGDSIYAAAPYLGVFRQAVQSFKYGSKTYFAPVLGQLMAKYLEAKAGSAFDMVIPVPLAPRKKTQRGFNQAELLAEVISQRLGIPCQKRLLLKVRETVTQAHLKRDKRLVNLQGAFTVTSELTTNPHFLLIDDIITTGTTVKEAALALRQAGAKRITILVWARSVTRK